MHDHEQLVAVLTASQQLGFLGARPITEVIVHAQAFVSALDGISAEGTEPPTVIDLGSGGGVPGLVIAHDRPDLQVTLLDRRSKRTDFLERMVRRLGWSDRVTVVCADAHDLVQRSSGHYAAAVARGFGPPEVTLGMGAALVRNGGRIVISEPPGGDRWDPGLLERVGVERAVGPGQDARVVTFVRSSAQS